MKRLILIPGMILLFGLFPGSAGVYGQHASDATGQQEEEERTLVISYGLNTGAYFAHKNTANYYSGSGRNNLEQAINRRHNYNRIRESLNYDFELHELPGDMAYNPAIMVGIFGNLHFSKRTALHAAANYTRLTAQDQFTLELKRPGFIEGDNIKAYSVYGNEERSELWLGLRHIYPSAQSFIHPFIEIGGSMTGTRVRQNSIRIEGITYSIRAPSDTYYNVRDDGVGFGAFAGGGVRMDVGDDYAFDLGFNSNYSRINLGGNNDYRMQYAFFVRLYLSHGPS